MSKMLKEQLELCNQDNTSIIQLTDCMFNEKHSARRTPKELEAVHQIIIDLVSNEVFTKNPGREGYVSFPKFDRNLLQGLDYRDLHKWSREHIDLWGSIKF